jgi:hypothetical protein
MDYTLPFGITSAEFADVFARVIARMQRLADLRDRYGQRVGIPAQ